MVAVLLLAYSIIACTPTPAPVETIEVLKEVIVYVTPTPTMTKRLTPIPATVISSPDQGMSNSEIVAVIKQNTGVLDAAISQQGKQVSLVLIVRPLVNESLAMQWVKTS